MPVLADGTIQARSVPAPDGRRADNFQPLATLPDDWKDRVDDKVAVHDFVKTFGRGVPPEKMEEMRATYPPARHPVIRTHPETGARGIYTNRQFTSHVEGVDDEESEAIIKRLERALGLS